MNFDLACFLRDNELNGITTGLSFAALLLKWGEPEQSSRQERKWDECIHQYGRATVLLRKGVISGVGLDATRLGTQPVFKTVSNEDLKNKYWLINQLERQSIQYIESGNGSIYVGRAFFTFEDQELARIGIRDALVAGYVCLPGELVGRGS